MREDLHSDDMNKAKPNGISQRLGLFVSEFVRRPGVDGVLIEGERWDLGNMQTYIQCLQAQAQAGLR